MARNGIDPNGEYARAVVRDKPPPKPPFALNADQMAVWRMITSTRAEQEWLGN